MAQDGGLQLAGADAHAVVRDADKRLPSVLDLDEDGSGPGIKAVLHELFHDACRAFDHFPRSYLVG